MSNQNQSQDQNDGGFILPPPGSDQNSHAAIAHASSSETTAATAQQIVIPSPADSGIASTSPRDMVIGGAILLVLLVGFFFARVGYANMLVRKRIAPAKANAAGWWLFVFLGSLATAVVLASINPIKFLAPMTLAPLGGVAVVALILMVLSSRR